MKKKVAVIIGAGPAGLTAAYELVTRTDITPIVLEKTDRIGGIATTINFYGNRIMFEPSEKGSVQPFGQDAAVGQPLLLQSNHYC